MKKQKILECCDWILTDAATTDKQLNPTDQNVLAVLQFMFDNKTPFGDGYYGVVLRDDNKAKYTVQGTLDELGFNVNQSTIGLSVNKLARLGYLDYRKGFYNNQTHSGQPAKIKILKGTITINDSISESCGDIAHRTEEASMCNNQITCDSSETYSDIAHSKKNNKYNNNNEVQELEGTYSYSSIELEKNDYNKSDVKRNEDTTLFGDGDVVFDLRQYLSDNVCSEKVMGDLLEWCIDNGWFCSDVQIQRVISATEEKCGAMALNEDYYISMFNRQQEKNRLSRLEKVCIL